MERKIGEVFKDGEVTLKVELETDEGSCKRCYYDPFRQCPNSLLETSCNGYDREDKIDVIFVQQENP
jgi:hypothetical protein